MPKPLQTWHLQALAELDILMEELDKIESLIWKKEETIKEVKKSMVLRYGTRGSGRLHNGIIAEIDGQPVIEKDGVLIIKCKESPYDGMSVSEYREKIVKPFLKRRRNKNKTIKREFLPKRPVEAEIETKIF